MTRLSPQRNIGVYIVFLVLLLVSTLLWSQERKQLSHSQSEPISMEQPELLGVLCLVRSDNRLLLVREYITDKLSLPGGSIKNGEDPRVAAQREMWEESGIAVDVLDQLGRTEHAIIYNCQVQSAIMAYKSSNYQQGVELPIFNAPHFGVEVTAAQLIEPDMLDVEQYRYPYQWPLIEYLYHSANNQSIHYINDLIGLAPSYQRIELAWLNELQIAVKHSPSWLQSLIKVGGELLFLLLKPLVLLILLSVFIWLWGRVFTAQLIFACVATSLFVLVTKQGFALPLPHVYLPTINFTQQNGYSFPDIYLANWSCISLIVMSQINQSHRLKFFLCAILFTAILVFYQFISGAAFLTDMVIGALIGLLSGWHFVRHYLSNSRERLAIFISVKGWSILLAVALLLTIIWPQPAFLGWPALSLGMLVYAVINSRCCAQTPMSLPELFISLVVVISAVSGFYWFVPTIAYEASYALISYTAIVVIIVALPALVMYVFRRKQIR